MATYPDGTLNAELAKQYQEILARKGIDLKLVPLAGSVTSVAELDNPNSQISVALVPGGITTAEESPKLVSLGTLFYQPLWIFSRNQLTRDHESLLQGHKHLGHLRISVGPEGSSSRALSLKLLGHAQVIDEESAVLLPYSPSDSAEKLIHGDIDVAILLDGWESPAVQRLLIDKSVHLESIPRADAFNALYPYLDKLILPTGVVDMAAPRPPEDVVLVATKSSLVVRSDLHPAIQFMLLEAAIEIHSTPGMFHGVGQFPAAESIDLPLSNYAREFYKTGTPFLLSHLPFWLAALLAEPVVWLIPVVVLLFPVLRIAPTIYDWAERRRIYKLYSELRRLEDDMLFAAPNGNGSDLIERLDRLTARASRLSVPTSFKPLVYSLRTHIHLVREEARKQSRMEP